MRGIKKGWLCYVDTISSCCFLLVHFLKPVLRSFVSAGSVKDFGRARLVGGCASEHRGVGMVGHLLSLLPYPMKLV